LSNKIEFSFLNLNLMAAAGHPLISNAASAPEDRVRSIGKQELHMFTKLTTALVVILGITSGAAAATAHQHHYGNPASAYGAAFDARATTARQHSPNSAWDVYSDGGHYVGSDPDPNVRMEMQMDHAGRD
jgi:hypothetical protein